MRPFAVSTAATSKSVCGSVVGIGATGEGMQQNVESVATDSWQRPDVVGRHADRRQALSVAAELRPGGRPGRRRPAATQQPN